MAKSIKLVWVSLSRSFSGAALPLSGGHVPGALPKRCSVHSPDLEPLLGMGHGGSKLEFTFWWGDSGRLKVITQLLLIASSYYLHIDSLKLPTL